MKKITFLLLIAVFSLAINSCENDDPKTEDLNYIGFESTSFNFPVDIDGTSDDIIYVYTTNTTNSDRVYTIDINVDLTTADPSSYTIPTTVTIPANKNVGEIPVVISDINIGVSGKTLVLKFAAVEDLYTSDDVQVNVTQNCPGNELYLDIIFDGYASECSWELLDSDDSIVASGSGYKDGTESYSTSFCLGEGTYTYSIYDAYGDGLTYPTTGGVTLTKAGVELVNINGAFGDDESVTFVVK